MTISDLVARLRAHGTWKHPPFDPGNYLPQKGTFTPDLLAIEAADALTAANKRADEAEARDGGLWRFWNEKAREHLARATAAEERVAVLEKALRNRTGEAV